MTNKHYSQYLLISGAVFALYILLYLFVDKPIALAVHAMTHPTLFHAAKIISHLGNYKLWIIISAAFSLVSFALLALGYQFSAHARKALFVFCSVFLAVVIGAVVKFVLARARPELLFEKGIYGFHFFSFQESYTSSPSGHTLSIFAVATSLSMLCKRYAPLFFLVAVCVGLSRIIVDAHYVGDVLLGAYVGIMAAMLCKRVPYFSTV